MQNDLIKNIISDLKVSLTDEFDRNFERKAFFDKLWQAAKMPNSRGSLLMRSSNLRNGIMAAETATGINYSNSMPYAALHNDGGIIKVTAKVKKFFWAMYYLASGAVTKKKDGTASNSKRNVALTAEAQYWKGLALMKLGAEIKIPQRQFIGHHPQVDRLVMQVIDNNVQDFLTTINEKLIR